MISFSSNCDVTYYHLGALLLAGQFLKLVLLAEFFTQVWMKVKPCVYITQCYVIEIEKKILELKMCLKFALSKNVGQLTIERHSIEIK